MPMETHGRCSPDRAGWRRVRLNAGWDFSRPGLSRIGTGATIQPKGPGCEVAGEADASGALRPIGRVTVISDLMDPAKADRAQDEHSDADHRRQHRDRVEHSP